MIDDNGRAAHSAERDGRKAAVSSFIADPLTLVTATVNLQRTECEHTIAMCILVVGPAIGGSACYNLVVRKVSAIDWVRGQTGQHLN